MLPKSWGFVFGDIDNQGGGQPMYLAYFDESGDDGYPAASTPLFVLTATYLHHLKWKENFQKVHDFRKALAKTHGLPFDVEFHTREFLLNKNPYRAYSLPPERRLDILHQFCTMAGSLGVRVVNVAINKQAIRAPTYDVLDTALTYSIQRIENDLTAGDSRFLIITDEGRVGKMRATTRKIQRYNPIPSKFTGQSYQREIKLLVEDPLPKNSRDSYFIQLSDMVAFLVTLRLRLDLAIAPLASRLEAVIDAKGVDQCLEQLRPILNLKASPNHPWGVACYPKP